MQQQTSSLDPRYFQVGFQALFLAYGIFFLHWYNDWLHYAVSISGCLLLSYLFESVKHHSPLSLTGANGFSRWGFSTLISAASLCLLLKTSHWSISLLAAVLTVASKYAFRYRQKHVFNPSAFGIVAVIFLTGNAWLSPAQWGSNTVIFFFAVTFGTIVVTRVQKLDVSLTFLLTYIGLLYWRQVGYLGWPADHFIHSVSTGSLLLFSFFMISDPRTTPDHPVARLIWGALIAGISFYLSVFKWQYNTAIWVLVIAAPAVPLLDAFFKEARFSWNPDQRIGFLLPRPFLAHRFGKKLAALVLLLTMISNQAMAFCGFYVSKADGTLKNKTSQVIVVRDGDRNVITMYNDFKGNTKDFAMVVPVPVVLQEKDIRVVSPQIFQTLNDYSKPRLVEYYDDNPCEMRERRMALSAPVNAMASSSRLLKEESSDKVKIEAKYLVGEYDILILSASESSGLKNWLDKNGYKIPKDADEVIEPYIKSNLKFFVVKVNEAAKKKLGGDFLRPIQIHFTSPKFMLPIRLGMANADGDQDMIVYGFSKKGRIECTNYRTLSLPTAKHIPLFVKENFGAFYSNLFQHQWTREGKAVAMLEYAWDVSPRNFMKCDPCVAEAPSLQDLVQAGVWWMDGEASLNDRFSGNVYFTRLHLRYNRALFPQDLQFQVTPNTDNYQARYIVTHPATGNMDCPAGKQYLTALKERRGAELEMMEYLTGKGFQDWDLAGATEESATGDAGYASIAGTGIKGDKKNSILFAVISLGLLAVAGWHRKNHTT